MASESDQGERTEEATQQRREDFRKRGQVAQTKELSSVLVLFSGVILIWVLSHYFFVQISELFRQSFGDSLVAAVRHGDWRQIAGFAVERLALMLAPIFALFWVISFASTVLQVGFLQNEEALQVRWDRIDPVGGLGRLFKFRSVIEGFKAIVKMSLILVISYFLLREQIHALPKLMTFSLAQILAFLGALTTRLMMGVGVFMVALAALDYFYQRWDLEKEMRMTKQEVREEIKSREGDPMIKARIKRVQREMSSKRMMEDVPQATVIVTNPTHIAVALRYDETLVAPIVVAKGAEMVAAKIREIAREHGVPIVENKPLARTMFKTIKIGQTIPRDLYTAVAEVLSYVFRMRRKART